MKLAMRIKTLENLRPIKPWFTIEIDGEATAAQWELINEAHANGRTVYIFQSVGDTLGVFLVGAESIYWGGGNES